MAEFDKKHPGAFFDMGGSGLNNVEHPGFGLGLNAGDGTTDGSPALEAADAAGGALLRPGRTVRTTGDITLVNPFNPNAGLLKPDAGARVVVTRFDRIPGRVKWIDRSAGGQVKLGMSAVHEVFPEWYGASGHAHYSGRLNVADAATVITIDDTMFSVADIGRTVWIGQRFITDPIVDTDGGGFAVLANGIPHEFHKFDAYIIDPSTGARTLRSTGAAHGAALGSTYVQTTDNNWTAPDEGKRLELRALHQTTIAAVLSDTQVQLAAAVPFMAERCVFLCGEDDSEALQAAQDSGFGTMKLGPTAYIGNFEVDDGAAIFGSNKKTRIISMPGSDADVIRSRGFDLLTDTPKEEPQETRGTNFIQLRDVIFDGAKAFNDAGVPIRIWGRSHRWQNVVAQNSPEVGIYTEFTTHDDINGKPEPLDYSVNAVFMHVQSLGNDGHGWQYRGPHDAEVIRYEGVANGGYALVTETKFVLVGLDLVEYYNGVIHFAAGWDSWNNRLGSYRFEGSVSGVHLTASGPLGNGFEFVNGIGNCRLTGCIVGGHVVGVLMTGSDNSWEGQIRECDVGIQIGVTAGDGAQNCKVHATTTSCDVHVLVENEAGANEVKTLSRVAVGETMRSGTFNPRSHVELIGWEGVSGAQQFVQIPGHVVALTGAGSPEGVVTATPGRLYMRTDGGASTTLYVKTSGTGNTGWTAK